MFPCSMDCGQTRCIKNQTLGECLLNLRNQNKLWKAIPLSIPSPLCQKAPPQKYYMKVTLHTAKQNTAKTNKIWRVGFETAQACLQAPAVTCPRPWATPLSEPSSLSYRTRAPPRSPGLGHTPSAQHRESFSRCIPASGA